MAQKRDAAATQKRILESARANFARHGFSGARIERIAHQSRANVQMIYRYFGGKEKLYLTVLEDTYEQIRALEQELDFAADEPVGGMRRLVEFTFDYLLEHHEFVSIILNENMEQGRFLKKSRSVPKMTLPLVEAIESLMMRGRAEGVFLCDETPMQIYVTILGLCFIHISNRHTLSVMFDTSLTDPQWLARRRQHIVGVVLRYVTTGAFA